MSDPRDFGARGDGRRDDTDALQHALSEGEGTLELRKATYRITRPLVVDTTRHGYASIAGKGGTSTIVMAGPGPALRVIGDHQGTADPTTIQAHTWQNERFPNFVGFEIVGEHPDALGIELFRTMQATLSRVAIRRCRTAIRLAERNRNFLLADCHLYDNHEFGLLFDHCNLHQAIIHGNHISYNKKAGIMSAGGDVHNVQITGNDIEYNNLPGEKLPADLDPDEPRAAEIWLDARDGTISEITIASNTIQATVTPGGANVRIHGPAGEGALGACLIAISGNVIGSQRKGIELKHAKRVAISGNTIYDSDNLSLDAQHCSGVNIAANTLVWRAADDAPPRDGLRLEDCDNVQIHGLNAERLCYGTPDQGGGVTLVRCRECAVSDSHILDPLVRGVELIDCRRCRVTDNTILDRRERPTMRHAIRVGGDSLHNIVQHNLVGGATEANIEVAGEATVRENVEV